MVLLLDVFTHKLPYLIRFIHFKFETSIVESVNSNQISLVMTCIRDCTIWKFSSKIEISKRTEYNLKEI